MNPKHENSQNTGNMICTVCHRKVESKLLWIDDEDENEIEEETSQHSAPPSNEGPSLKWF